MTHTSTSNITRFGLRSRDSLVGSRGVHSQYSVRRRLEHNDDADDDEMESDSEDSEDYEAIPKVSIRSRWSRKGTISPKRKPRTQQRTDKVLTFLQNARRLNMPVRAGKWNEEEDNYLRKLVRLFNLGVLDDIEEKTSMRSWLAKMLNCCPMRISKKQMHGERFKGKAKYKRCRDRVERMGQEEYTNYYHEIHQLRVNFLKHWAKEEFGKLDPSDKQVGFETWYNKVMTTVPEPKIAKNTRIKVPVEHNTPSAEQLIEDHVQSSSMSQPSKRVHHSGKRSRASISLDLNSPKSKVLRLDSSTPSQPDDDKTTCVCVSPLVLMRETPTTTLDFDIGFAMYEEDDFELLQLVLSESTDPDDDLYCREVMTPEPESPRHDELILDFGPPSMWNCDPDTSSYGSPISNDDFLFDDDYTPTDSSLLTPYELPTGSWLQSVLAASKNTPY